jgi:hypothetical protein
MGASAVIEIRPHRSGGWECYEAPGVQPYFREGNGKESAIEYATGRMKGRRGEIRIYDAAGQLERTERFGKGD